MNQPLLSIVIATKNRVVFCINTVETLLALKDQDLQIVVQDNTDNEELKAFIIANIDDNRLIYNYTPPPFSPIDNFNKCVELATGEYICMIGDDDGINPEFLNIVRLAKINGIESLGSSQIAEYYWPNAVDKYKDGNFSIPRFNGTTISYDPSTRLKPLLLTGIVNYISFNLPRVYHGLIKKSVLDKIKTKHGNYFNGLSPDIYSSIALSTVVQKHFVVDYPMTIAGTCASSTSAASENGEHTGRLEDAPHFRNREDYIWDEMIPRYYSIQTIWAETGLKALRNSGKSHLIKYFNFNFLVAQSISLNPKLKQLILNQSKIVIKAHNKSVLLFNIYTLLLLFVIKFRRYIYWSKAIIGKQSDTRKHFSNVKTINEATHIINNYIAIKEFNVKSLFNKS